MRTGLYLLPPVLYLFFILISDFSTKFIFLVVVVLGIAIFLSIVRKTRVHIAMGFCENFLFDAFYLGLDLYFDVLSDDLKPLKLHIRGAVLKLDESPYFVFRPNTKIKSQGDRGDDFEYSWITDDNGLKIPVHVIIVLGWRSAIPSPKEWGPVLKIRGPIWLERMAYPSTMRAFRGIARLKRSGLLPIY